MSIGNYSELKTAVLSWVNHPQASGKEGDFIALAEGEMNADLKVKPMNQDQTVSVPAGNVVSLPANVIDPIRFQVVGATHPDVVITTLEALDKMVSRTQQFDSVKVYGALVGRTLRLFPAFTATRSVVVHARCSLPALSDAAPTNWLLTAFPNVYLFAALREAGSFLHDAQMVTWAEQRYQQSASKINGLYVYRGQMAASTVHGVR